MGSLPKPRCARGPNCYHVRKHGLDGPPSVGRAGDLCEKCSKEKPHLDQMPARHREVLRAAQVLFDAGIAQEGLIYGTIVCAAWAGEDQQFKRMRDSVLEAEERSELWETLQHRFANAFASLEPWDIRNGILLVRRSPVDVLEVRADDGELTKEIVLEVRDRSATGEDVRIQYEKCLSRFGLPHVTGAEEPSPTTSQRGPSKCWHVPRKREHFILGSGLPSRPRRSRGSSPTQATSANSTRC